MSKKITKKVSVIMPNYNYGRYIESAIRSVLDQSYRDWELIIVDDGSTDNSVETIKKYVARYPDKIKLYQHQDKKNKNLSITYQLGLAHARGEYLTFLESDDIWFETSLEEKVAVLDKEKDVFLVFSDIELFGEPGARMDQIKKTLYVRTETNLVTQKPFYSIDFITKNLIPTFSVVMIRQSEFMHLNFNPPEAYLAWLDWWIWGQCSVCGALYYIPKKLTKWRVHLASNNSLNDNKAQKIAGYQEKFCQELTNCMRLCLGKKSGQGLCLKLFEMASSGNYPSKKDKIIERLKVKLFDIESSKCWKIVLHLRYIRQAIERFVDFFKTNCKEEINNDPLYIFISVDGLVNRKISDDIRSVLGKTALELNISSEGFNDFNWIKSYLKKLSQRKKRKIKVIHGSAAFYGIDKYFERNCRYLFFLEKPRSRFYYLFSEQKLGKGGLGPWINNYHLGSNQISKQILREGRFLSYDDCAGDRVVQTKQILDKAYFVGVHECLGIDLAIIYNMIGIRKSVPWNLSIGRVLPKNSESDEAKKRIDVKLQEDKEIYKCSIEVNRLMKRQNQHLFDAVTSFREERHQTIINQRANKLKEASSYNVHSKTKKKGFDVGLEGINSEVNKDSYRINNTKPIYVFVHLPKTAGTLIKSFLDESLPKESLLSFYTNKQLIVNGLQEMSQEFKQKIEVIIGHRVFWGIEKQFFRPARYIIFVRDPVYRFLSEYNYKRMRMEWGSFPEWGVADSCGNLLPFSKWLENSFKLSSLDFLDRFDKNSDSELTVENKVNKAKQILNRFYYLGITERLSEDLEFLGKEIGVPFDSKKKINQTKINYVSLSYKDIYDLIDHYMPWEHELYRYSLEINDRLKRDNDKEYYNLLAKGS